jgi:hypothetical protein
MTRAQQRKRKQPVLSKLTGIAQTSGNLLAMDATPFPAIFSEFRQKLEIVLQSTADQYIHVFFVSPVALRHRNKDPAPFRHTVDVFLSFCPIVWQHFARHFRQLEVRIR